MAPKVELPIVNPLIVTTNADKPIAAPDVSIKTEDAAVALHATTKFVMLLAAALTVGVTSEAKKAEG